MQLTKKGEPKEGDITAGQALGREINSQVGDYLREGPTGVVGVCCPQKLEDGLASALRWQAELVHKKIVFMGTEELTRVIYQTMKTRKLSLNDL
jgi:hypothetical protein